MFRTSSSVKSLSEKRNGPIAQLAPFNQKGIITRKLGSQGSF